MNHAGDRRRERCSPTPNDPLATLRSDDMAFYDPLRRWIAARRIRSRALKAGDPAPEFLLPDDRGHLVSSRKLLANGPVVLSFFGGTWCPFCVTRLKALTSALAPLREHHVSHYALTPETGVYLRRARDAYNIDVSLLADLDSGVGLLFGVIFVVPEAIGEVMRTRGIHLERLQGATTPMLSLPSTFVVARDGTIGMAQIEEDYTREVDVGPVVEAARAIADVPRNDA